MKINYIGRNKDLECYICHRTRMDSIISIKNELDSIMKVDLGIKDRIQDEITKFGYFSDVYFFDKFGEALYPEPFNFANKFENYLFDKNILKTLQKKR